MTNTILRVMVVLEGDNQGSWINYHDLRAVIAELTLRNPDDANTLLKLDQALLAGMINKEET